MRQSIANATEKGGKRTPLSLLFDGKKIHISPPHYPERTFGHYTRSVTVICLFLLIPHQHTLTNMFRSSRSWSQLVRRHLYNTRGVRSFRTLGYQWCIPLKNVATEREQRHVQRRWLKIESITLPQSFGLTIEMNRKPEKKRCPRGEQNY